MRNHTEILRRTITAPAIAILTWVVLTSEGLAANPQSSSSKGTSTTSSAVVDVNTADAATLATLPGVGPTIAQRIIDGRPYHSLADLEKVKGLSHTRVHAFQDQVTFGATRTKAKTTTSSKTYDSGASSSSSTTRGNNSSSSTRTTETASTSKLAPGEKININTASAAELDRLPGIGKSKSQAIIDYREQHGDFKSLEDIQNVKGIKGGEFEKLKDHIKLR